MSQPWREIVWIQTDNFFADTKHLRAAELGAYMSLLIHYWAHDGLPCDDKKLAAITKAGKKWENIKPVIQEFFTENWSPKASYFKYRSPL